MLLRSLLRAVLLPTALFASGVWATSPVFGAGGRTPPPQQAPWEPAASSPGGAAEAGPAPSPKDPVAQCLQNKLNEARTLQGVLPLPEIPSLLEVAQKHSDLMAMEQSLHHSSEGVFQLLPPGWRAYGENVVLGTTCEQMFEAFLASDPHREAMLRPDFNVSGTAVATGPDGWIYATLVFLNLPDPPPASVPATPAPSPPEGPAMAPEPVAPPPPVPPPPPAEASPVPTISLGAWPLSSATVEQDQTSDGKNMPGAAGSSRIDGNGTLRKSGRSGQSSKTPARVSADLPVFRELVFELESGTEQTITFLVDDADEQPGPRPSGMS